MRERTDSSGISFGGVLLLIFITLKLTNLIDWSWWWVLAPLWMPLTVVCFVLLVVFFLRCFEIAKTKG